MAKARVVHSDDACTIIFKGNPKSPEPSMGAIRFPGGRVEVSRCSDGTYYAHLYRDEDSQVVDSRIDYDYEYSQKHGIPDIPDQDNVQKLAMRIDGQYKDWEDI